MSAWRKLQFSILTVSLTALLASAGATWVRCHYPDLSPDTAFGLTFAIAWSGGTCAGAMCLWLWMYSDQEDD